MQVLCWLGNAKVCKENVGHVMVVVLARMHDDVFMTLGNQSLVDRCKFYELRSCADNTENLHMTTF
jgi:hypothetical protein